MPYASKQDLIDRFGEAELVDLTDQAGLGTVDETAITRALADADDLIDAALAGRYQLPLAEVPRILTGLACDIARFKLHRNGAPEAVRKAFEDARGTLDRIAAGRLTLQVAGIAPAQSGDGAVLIDAPARRFTDAALADFIGGGESA